MKTCLIRQPAGLGDILFTLKIAYRMKDKGYDIVWPVIKEFKWLSDYIEGINFCTLDEEFKHKDKYNCKYTTIVDRDIIIPLQDADQHFPCMSVMLAKYAFVGLSCEGWQDYIKINRNANKEQRLLSSLKLDSNTKYTLVNNTFGSPPDSVVCMHMKNLKFDTPTIYMKNIPDFSVFDWIGVMEKCETIHTTDTCTIYLLETLSKESKLYMYSRFSPSNFFHVRDFLKKEWNFVY